MSSINLLSTQNYVSTPYIEVKIGKYSLGIFDNTKSGIKKFPNFVKGLEVTKINGQVNEYTLNLDYQITQNDDPNYIERILSSVSDTRTIEFTYGDMSTPSYIYKNEEAIITKVTSSFNISNSLISYTIEAVSSGKLLNAGSFPFKGRKDRPSEVIREILTNKKYGLQEIFTGMINMTQVEQLGLIPTNDMVVDIEAQSNITVLEYLQYLVSMMTTSTSSTAKNKSFFVLKYSDDTSGILGGTYFEIKEVNSSLTHSEAYDLDIGYNGSNAVISFNVENNENYSIYYNYAEKLSENTYVQRLLPDGTLYEEYAPIISSNNDGYKTTEAEKSWWAKVTQYPIKCSVSIKGLLRPALLMSYVRLKVYFYGNKHITSGLYIITKQVDKIDASGYLTTLNMTRIAEDDDFVL